MAGARPIVDPPAFTSLPYGLWDTAQQPTAPGHWQNGVTYIERCPTGGTTYDECIAVTGTGMPPEPEPKSANVTQDFRGATPITVFARFDCSPVGLADVDTVAADALARVEESQLETAFWTGSAGGVTTVFPHLASDAVVEDAQSITLQTAASVCITGVDAAHGLGVLEQCLDDCYDGQGVLHVPRLALATLDAWGLVRDIGGTLRTLSGNLVVVGGGYPNTGPDGTAATAGTAWIYATGAVFGYRGDVFATQVRDSLDRAENTVEMLAERTYVVAWECCHLAALINLGVPED